MWDINVDLGPIALTDRIEKITYWLQELFWPQVWQVNIANKQHPYYAVPALDNFVRCLSTVAAQWQTTCKLNFPIIFCIFFPKLWATLLICWPNFGLYALGRNTVFTLIEQNWYSKHNFVNIRASSPLALLISCPVQTWFWISNTPFPTHSMNLSHLHW